MICEYLKKETNHYHTEAEKNMGAVRIFDNNYNREEYIRLLNVLFISHYATEYQLSKAELPDFIIGDHYTNKHDLIKNDLIKMSSFQNLKVPEFKIDNNLEAIGVLYVLKGSEMGANIIYKQLQKTFSDEDEISLEFYSFGSDVFGKWRDFCQCIDALVLSMTENTDLEIAKQKILGGAVKAYLHFINCSQVK